MDNSTGDLRLRLPVPNDAYTGTHQVTAYGPSCPQLSVSVTPNVLVLPPATIQFFLTDWSRPTTTETLRALCPSDRDSYMSVSSNNASVFVLTGADRVLPEREMKRGLLQRGELVHNPP